MARYGGKYPVIGKLNENFADKSVSHANGMQIGEVISITANWTINVSPLYASNRIVESVRKLTGGTLSVNTDKIIPTARTMMFGHKIRKDTVGDKEINAMSLMSGDENPYIGFGFYGIDVENGNTIYHAVWFPKVQFSEPNVSAQTSAESAATWQTPTVEATIMESIDGMMMDEAWDFDEAVVIAWLNKKADITPAQDI